MTNPSVILSAATPVIPSEARDLHVGPARGVQIPRRFAPRDDKVRWVVGVVMLLALSGCIHGKLPAREFYRLRTAPLPDSLTAFYRDGGVSTLPVGSVAIVPYIAPGVYGDGNIVYRIGDSEMGTYPNREWALPVPTMLGMLTEDIFRARPLTRDPVVFDPPSAHSYDYVWRGLVREFEELDRGSHVYAVVRFDARLVRARDDSVLWSGTARLERAVPEGTMPAIVDALSQLATEAIVQLQESARGSLAGPAASAVRAPQVGRGSRP